MKNLLSRLFLLMITGIFPLTSQATSIQLKDVHVGNLTKEYQQWFMKEFPKGFMAVYQDKAFVITKEGKPTILGPMDIKAKKNGF